MYIKNYNLSDEIVREIGKFAILWSDFENRFFGCKCDAKQIENRHTNICIDNYSQVEFAKALNNRLRNFHISVQEYVDDRLHPTLAIPSSPDNKQAMKDFIEQKGEDNRLGCLLVICRLRNNMMHGLKELSDLNTQLELFKAMNGVLESIRRLPLC